MNKKITKALLPKKLKNQISKIKIVESPFLLSQESRGMTSLILHFTFCILILCGCSGPTEPTLSRDASPVETALVTSRTTAKKVAAASEEVLTGMNFEIDKIDPDTGYVKTKSLPGAQFFEFWRSDNIGTKNQLLANLHSIRRTVEIEYNPEGIDCKAHLQRLAMPERQIANTTSASNARAYGMFTVSSPAMQTLLLTAEQQRDAEWIDLGRDTALENEIVKRIKTKILTSE